MELGELLGGVDSPKKFVEFVRALRKDLADNREGWENWTLSDYLESMERMIDDNLDNPENPGIRTEPAAAWHLCASILFGASMYE